MNTKVSPVILRVAIMFVVVGASIEVALTWNGDQLGWSLLRFAALFLALELMKRVWTGSMARAQLESRLESLRPQSKSMEARPAFAGQ